MSRRGLSNTNQRLSLVVLRTLSSTPSRLPPPRERAVNGGGAVCVASRSLNDNTNQRSTLTFYYPFVIHIFPLRQHSPCFGGVPLAHSAQVRSLRRLPAWLGSFSKIPCHPWSTVGSGRASVFRHRSGPRLASLWHWRSGLLTVVVFAWTSTASLAWACRVLSMHPLGRV